MADAMDLEFEDYEFGLIACYFGIMFFTDKLASFREVTMVLKPYGRSIFNRRPSMLDDPKFLVSREAATHFLPVNTP